jgi:hypothetical protein
LIDRDPDDAFVLIDPAVGRQRGQVFLLRCLELFRAHFGAFLFVGIAARRCFEHDESDQAEDREEQHNSDPRRERGARLMMLDWLGSRHG